MSFSEPSPQNFLLMVENSSALAPFWSDLRDCYLPRLVEQLSGTLPAHLTNIFITESRSTSHDLQSSVTKQCSNLEAGLTECQFNYSPDNWLSVAQIQTGIMFLSNAPANQLRHLIVVAATTPKDFGIVNLPYDPWIELAKMLTKEDVYFHLALTSNLRSGRLPNLFQQTLKMQKHTEEPLWLPKYSTALIFRVSAPQSYPDAVQVISDTKSPCPASRTQREHIPSDMYTNKALEDTSPESPSLVSKLQQVHGLTKKKVYGAKPVRIPFILDEKPRDHKAPSQPLASETGAPPLLPRTSRSRSNLKADRPFSSRLQRIVTPYSAGQPQFQRQRQPTSPCMEGEFSGESPYSSSSLSLPASPVAPSPESYPYAVGSSGAGYTTLPLDVDLSWAPAADSNTCSGMYPSASGYNTESACFPHYEPFPQDSTAPPPFQGFPTPCEIISTSLAFSAAPALAPPAAYLPQRPHDFGTPGGELDFRLNPFQQHYDEQGEFPFPATAHIHAPAPCVPLPAAAQMDLEELLTSGAGAASLLPAPAASIFPQITPPAPFEKKGSVTLSMPPPTQNDINAMCLAPPSPSTSSSKRMAAAASSASLSAHAFASSSSSSLTGWAG
ncbi:hypothetical protein C8R45DRAFT_1161425 [Mycena sanguinolenta]|nr:hypothetical protein C8R45DRAFT_1161425 [Mycena sanguinolenta]